VNVTRTNVTEPKKIWDSMQKSKILSGDASLLISDTKIVEILAIAESSLLKVIRENCYKIFRVNVTRTKVTQPPKDWG